MKNGKSEPTYVVNAFPFNIPKIEAKLADGPPKNQSVKALTSQAHFNQCQENPDDYCQTSFTQCPQQRL